MKLPPTAQRVENNTSRSAKDDIRNKTIFQIEQALKDGNIDREMAMLQREWDTERVLETNAACLMLISLGLGMSLDRRWLWLTGGVAAFLLQHALQGWCPPLPVIRAMGVRTAGEIGIERTALKALRGDFIDMEHNAESAFKAASLE